MLLEGGRAGVVHAEITGVRKKNVWSTKASFSNNKEELDMLNNDVRVNKWLSIEYRDGPQSGKCTFTKDGSVLECPVTLHYNNLLNASRHFLSSHRSQLQQAWSLTLFLRPKP